MSGHNKWSKIKNKKAITDAKKSKIFSKIAKLIALESKLAGGDVSFPGLKTAIDKAKEVNMPADNIERAVKKGGSKDMTTLENMTYESYGPGGVAIIITALSDNRNKTAAEIKHILTKNGLELAQMGSAVWAFEKIGSANNANHNDWIPKITIDITEADGEKLEKIIEDLEDNDDVQDVFTNVS